MDYQKKYLKYKNKYLELKQKGGNNRASIDDEEIGITCDELPKFGFGNRHGTCWLIVCMIILLFCENRKLQTIFIENKNNTIDVSAKYNMLSTFIDVTKSSFTNNISKLIENFKNRFLIKNNLKQEINNIPNDFEDCISIFNLFKDNNEIKNDFRIESKITEISQELSYFSLINTTQQGANILQLFLFLNIISILLLDKYICTKKVSTHYEIPSNNIGILIKTSNHVTCFLKCSKHTYYINNDYVVKYDYIKFFNTINVFNALGANYKIIYIHNMYYLGPCIILDNNQIKTFFDNSDIILNEPCTINKINKKITLRYKRNNTEKISIVSFDDNITFYNCYFTDENNWYKQNYDLMLGFIETNITPKNNIIKIYENVDHQYTFNFLYNILHNIKDDTLFETFCQYIKNKNIQLQEVEIEKTLKYIILNSTGNILTIFLNNINITTENINRCFDINIYDVEIFNILCQYIKNKNIQLLDNNTLKLLINIISNNNNDKLIILLDNITINPENINICLNQILLFFIDSNVFNILCQYIKNKNIQLSKETVNKILNQIFGYYNERFDSLLQIFLENINITEENINNVFKDIDVEKINSNLYKIIIQYMIEHNYSIYDRT